MMTRRPDSPVPAAALPWAASRRLLTDGLTDAWADRPRMIVLDLGWSGGATLLASLHRWRADPRRCAEVHWVAWLPEPLSRSDLVGRLDREGVAACDQSPLTEVWPPPVSGISRRALGPEPWWLTLAVGPVSRSLYRCVPSVQFLHVGLDGLPGSDEPARLRRAVQMLEIGATIVVSAPRAPCGHSGRVTAALRALESAGGRLSAVGSGGWVGQRRHGQAAAVESSAQGERSALVLGAGLAGAASAAALARRGWAVDRLDGSGPAGSMQPVLAQHPSLSVDDAPLSQLTRAAVLLAESDPATQSVIRLHGRVQLASAEQARAVCEGLPTDWVQAVDAHEASARAGVRLKSGGWWLPRVGSVDPRELIEAWTLPGVRVHGGAQVSWLQRQGSQWVAYRGDGTAVAAASIVVVATGADGLRIQTGQSGRSWMLTDRLAHAGLQWRPGTSLIAHLPARAVPRCTVGGAGHAVPLDSERLLLGPWADVDAAAVSALDAVWTRWTDQLSEPIPYARLERGPSGIRLSTRDHLPLVGPVPAPTLPGSGADQGHPSPLDADPPFPGLWMVGAFGGRGLLWAGLCAEILAARLTGEPLPVGHWLAHRLDPARFESPHP